MHCKNFLLVILLFFCSATSILAQSSASLTDNPLILNEESLAELTENWSFFIDEENQLYYIDFENLKINLSDITVKNEAGEVLLKDDVFDLPVNTIYELDFSEYGSGRYEVELRSFTGTLRKMVEIQ